jgi:CDP-6-deoxy-D-xylo-4-hexulose-3-dehydrase
MSITMKTGLRWPLMKNNILREDLDAVIRHLQQDDPILTAGPNVRKFEEEWSEWLGVRHSVMVNSGASANQLTLEALKLLHGKGGEVIVPTITWVSDIASVLHAGFKPVFVDINPRNLAMDAAQILQKITPQTRAVFLTHVLGYNGLSDELLAELRGRDIPLIEDVCESHGATHRGQKLGTFGWASNFSFYYAHHLSTIEGGMVCTNNADLYECVRMLRAHGMVRELDSLSRKHEMADEYPDLNPDFIFAHAGFNCRSTEINALIGRSQLSRLNENIEIRTRNLKLFLENLDPRLYRTDFQQEGSSNYAFTLILKEPDARLCKRVMTMLREERVEFRRGTAGGGNQVRQPYLRDIVSAQAWKEFPNADHVHFYGFYIGNYPALEQEQILWLCERLNQLGDA